MPRVSLLTLIAAIFVLRLNFAVWGLIGACRAIDEKLLHRGVRPTSQDTPGVPDVIDVAAILPAHNEALVIERTLEALARILPVENIHVVSDGSSDDTHDLAQSFGVRFFAGSPRCLPQDNRKDRGLRKDAAHKKNPRAVTARG